jgi:putative peptidoglycan lipid II flippase
MRRIAAAAAIIFLGNVASRILGLTREMVFAALFGTSGAMSAYRTAARVQIMVYDLLVSGAISAALVPVFSQYAEESRAALGQVVSVVLSLLALVLGVVVLVLIVAAPALVGLLGADAQYFDLTVTLTRWALLSVVLLGVAGVLTAALHARRDFKWAALATAAYNVGIIGAALVLTPLWGVEPDGSRPDASVVALALGLVVGAALQVLVQVPGLRDLPWRLAVQWRHPGVRTAVRLYTPVALGFAVTYLGVFVDTRLAWRTGEESLAILQAATTLIQFPLGLVSSAVALAALPTLARAAHSGATDQYLATLRFATRLVLLLILPATVGLIALREPVVAWLFQRGAFTAAATEATARAFLFYAPQLPLVALDQLFIAAYYARQNTRTPMLVGVGTVLLYLVTAPALCTCVDLPALGRADIYLGRDGLALANALQNGMHGVLMYLLLRQRFPALAEGLGGYLARVGSAAVAMGALLVAVEPALGTWARGAPGPSVVAGGLLGLACYALLLLLLRVQEAAQLVALARARLRLRPG